MPEGPEGFGNAAEARRQIARHPNDCLHRSQSLEQKYFLSPTDERSVEREAREPLDRASPTIQIEAANARGRTSHETA